MPFLDATLMIVGHGSTVNDESSATVYQHAAELRRRRIFVDVREAFFKIEPRIRPVLDSIQTPRIFVVPFFTAEGYFTRQAIPAELGISLEAPAKPGPQSALDSSGRELFYCQPVGTHPLMTKIILARAEAVLSADAAGWTSHSTPSVSREGNSTTPPVSDRAASSALVLAAHGTRRNPDSRSSVERQVQLIAAQNRFAEVHCAFLEEEPLIADIPKFVKAREIVVVPFFLGDGLHVCEDIPWLLGEMESAVETRLKSDEWPWRNPTERFGRRIFYTRSVGSEPGIADVILERVQAAAAPGGDRP